MLTVVNVMHRPGVGAQIAPPSEERNRQWHVLDEARRLLAGRALEVRTLAPVGEVVDEILDAARDVGADVIVVGRRRGRIPRGVGSISGRIVRAADADVLVVHDDGTLLELDVPPEGNRPRRT